MVRDVWSREHAPRPLQWQTERPGPQEHPDDGRLSEAVGTRSPLPSRAILQALRKECRIPAKKFFLAVLLDNNETLCFAGPDNIPNTAMTKLFDMDKWVRGVTRQGSGASPSIDDADYGLSSDYPRRSISSEYASRREPHRRRSLALDALEEEEPTQKMRKRPRPHIPLNERRNEDYDVPIPIVTSKKGIKIGSSLEIWEFYGQRFRSLQQTACKLIAKTWVKTIEPRKQTTHPYTGSDEKAPEWWPKPFGPNKDDRVRHKEPDHLYKKERVYLLSHILRMILEPRATQHPDIQRTFLNVVKLEELTMEAMASFFSDKDNPNNAKKKPFLKEVFKVARMEERYKNGEIDGEHEVYVQADDKIPERYISDDESSLHKGQGNAISTSANPNTSAIKTTAGHGIMQATSPNHSPGSGVQGAFNCDLPVRGPPYQQQMLSTGLEGPDPHSYVDGANIQVSGQTPLQPTASMSMPEIHDSGRRPLPMFNSAADFASSSGSGMYHAWQGGTTAPGNSALYAFATQHQQAQQGSFVSQAAVPMTQSQSYMGQAFDGLPPRGYDHQSQSTMFRPINVSQNPVPPQQGYTYMTSDGRAMHSPGGKMEGIGRGQI